MSLFRYLQLQQKADRIYRLAELVKRKKDLRTRFAIIKGIASNVDDSGIAWLEGLERDALSSYQAADVADIPILIETVKSRGAEVLEARYETMHILAVTIPCSD